MIALASRSLNRLPWVANDGRMLKQLGEAQAAVELKATAADVARIDEDGG